MNAKQQRLIAAVLREQKKAFRKKFGRDPQPNESGLGDPSGDQPAHLTGTRQGGLTLRAIRYFDVPSHFAFAYEHTGLIVTAENMDTMSTGDLRRWDAAIGEYFQMERLTKAAGASTLTH